MKRLFTQIIMLAVSLVAMAQGQVKGLVLDKATSEAMPFVSVHIS